MKRRGFVGLLGLVAGCSAQLPTSNEQGGVDPGSARTPVPASNANLGEANATPSPATEPVQEAEPVVEPVEEPEPPVEPVEEVLTDSADEDTDDDRPLTDREVRGLERLASADRKITAIVNAFTDGYGTELTDVTAMSTGFLQSEYDVKLALADAQKSYVRARGAAANAEQDLSAAQLIRCWQFLRHATRTQVSVVEGYEQVVNALTEFERDAHEDGIVAADELETVLKSADRSFADALAAASVEDTAAVSSISAEEYTAKVAQFEADIAVYRDLDAVIREFAEGVKWLRRAKAYISGADRNVQKAHEAAKDARAILRDARKSADAVRNNAGEGSSLTPVLLAFRELSYVKIDEANDVLE